MTDQEKLINKNRAEELEIARENGYLKALKNVKDIINNMKIINSKTKEVILSDIFTQLG